MAQQQLELRPDDGRNTAVRRRGGLSTLIWAAVAIAVFGIQVSSKTQLLHFPITPQIATEGAAVAALVCSLPVIISILAHSPQLNLILRTVANATPFSNLSDWLPVPTQDPDTPLSKLKAVASRIGARFSVAPPLRPAPNIVKQSDKAVESRPPGLGNWANFCYQNSVLQSLASLDAVCAYLSNFVKDQPSARVKSQSPTSLALLDIIETLNDPLNANATFWTPSDLKAIQSWQQQDAQEYLSKIMELSEKEVATWRRWRSEKGLRSFESPGKIDLDGVQAPQDPLEGLLAQRVVCTTCGYSEGLNINPFTSLTLTLGVSPQSFLEDLLVDYTAMEAIEGVECQHCTLSAFLAKLKALQKRMSSKEPDDSASNANVRNELDSRIAKTDAALSALHLPTSSLSSLRIPQRDRLETTKTKQLAILRPPKCLVLHLNRSMMVDFGGAFLSGQTSRKNTAAVLFPPILDMTPFIVGSDWSPPPETSLLEPKITRSSKRAVYKLKAIITHAGSHDNGHYIAYRRHSLESKQKPKWWRISDAVVWDLSEEEVLALGRGVFMIFYELDEGLSEVQAATPEGGESDEEPFVDITGSEAEDPDTEIELSKNQAGEFEAGTSVETGPELPAVVLSSVS